MNIKKIAGGTVSVPLVIVAGLLVIYFFFLPPVLKFIIENQGEKYLGRKVKVGYTTFNIFRGSFNMNHLRIYEPDREKLFLSFTKFYVNLNIPEVFRNVYHIEAIGLDEPVLHITQADSTFNFSDILARFSSDSAAVEEEQEIDTTDAGPLKFIVEDFALTSGTVSYYNPDFKLKDTMKNLNLVMPLLAWDNPVTDAAFRFEIASGGAFRGDCRWTGDEQVLILNDTIANFNLSNYKHYLDPYLVTGSLGGFLNTRNMLIVNASTYDLTFKGKLSLDDVRITDSSGYEVASFEQFAVAFDSISFSEDIMDFDTISLISPVINFIMTTDGDNFSAMMPVYATDSASAETGTETETAYDGENPVEMMVAYIQESLHAYLFEDYRINQVILHNGKITYDDRTLTDPFVAVIDSMNLNLSNLTTQTDRSFGSLDARLNEEGHLSADISVDPRNLLNMDLKYEVSSLMVPDFNPYSVHYIAYPFPRGAFNYKGSLVISDYKLSSDNNIVIEKIYLGEKVKNSTALMLPIKLAIAILRDRDGNIQLEVPVKGDLNDPKVKIGRIILNILKNIIIKAATAPYDLLANAFGGDENDYKELKYDYLQALPGDMQKKQLENMAAILTEKPELNITFSQVVDLEKEKIAIAVFETKKLYYFEFLRNRDVPEKLTAEDSLELARINPEKELHSFFASRLDETLMQLSLEEKCYFLAGVENVNRMQKLLADRRSLDLTRYFSDELVVPKERFSVVFSTDLSLINPEYPYFSIKFDVEE